MTCSHTQAEQMVLLDGECVSCLRHRSALKTGLRDLLLRYVAHANSGQCVCCNRDMAEASAILQGEA